MAEHQKFPSEETGTFSIYNSSDDKDNVIYLGWEKIGAAKVWSKSLRKAREHRKLKRDFNRFLDGELKFGEFWRRLMNL